MAALFIASLSSLRSSALSTMPNGSVIDTINVIDIYSLICYCLDIVPSPNNGSVDSLLPFLASKH
jgi:hypothetical protein